MTPAEKEALYQEFKGRLLGELSAEFKSRPPRKDRVQGVPLPDIEPWPGYEAARKKPEPPKPGQIDCPACHTRFDVSPYDPGSKVRCGRCSQVLTVPEAS